MDRFITIAIHTYEKAVSLRNLLESEGIPVEFRNVNIEHPAVSSGVRVRIRECDLPLALRIIENREIFNVPAQAAVGDDGSKPVVVPVNFGEKSFEAVKAAFRIAAAHASSIVLLNSYVDPYLTGALQLSDSMTYEIADASARDQMKTVADSAMSQFAARIRDGIKHGEITPVNFKTRVVEGVPEDAISEFARSCSPSLIVMSTRGPEEKESDLIGSVTAEVLDKCRFPVLSIPETYARTADVGSFSNVLFFSSADQQDILAVDALHRIFPSDSTKVTLAYVVGRKRSSRRLASAMEALRDYCSNNFSGFGFELAEISDDNTLEDVRGLQRKVPFDLIVVPNRKKNIFSRIFSPTLAHRILYISDLPMLVIPV